MQKLNTALDLLFPRAPFDAIAVGVIDFKNLTFETSERCKTGEKISYYYDLASVTKVLTNSLSYFLNPSAFDEGMLLCLSHRGGLPAWGLLPDRGWEQTVLSYEIRKSLTLYSTLR